MSVNLATVILVGSISETSRYKFFLWPILLYMSFFAVAWQAIMEMCQWMKKHVKCFRCPSLLALLTNSSIAHISLIEIGGVAYWSFRARSPSFLKLLSRNFWVFFNEI